MCLGRLIIVFAVFLAFPVAAEEAMPRVISVTGDGRVAAAPDMATVRIGVRREARQAADAMRASSEAMRAVLASLDGAGIEARDIQTSGLGLSPRYARSDGSAPPRVVGYVASNDLTVRVRELEALGGILDLLIRDGANALNGVFFGIAETGPLEDQARASAVGDARAKAETLAEAAGVPLGAVLSISEGDVGSGPMPVARGAMMEAAMDVPVAGGEVEVRVSVSMVFEIGE